MRLFRWLYRNKWWLITSVIVVAAFFYGVRANMDGPSAAAEMEYTVERRDIVREETVTGSLEAKSQIDVKAKVGGILKEVPVKEGDTVTRGMVLARIDEVDLRKALKLSQARYNLALAQYEKQKKGGTREQVSSLEADVKNREVELELARENLNRIQTLYDKGYSSDQELEDAKGRLDRAQAAYEDIKQRLEFARTSASPEDLAIAEATLKQSKLQLDLAQEDLQNATIRSEVDGKVLAVELDPGDTVVPSIQGREGNVIMIVGDTTAILVQCEIGEDLIGVLNEGMDVEFDLSFIKDRKVPGKITRISHFGRPNQNGVVMFPMEMELAEDVGEPRLGSTARGKISVAKAENVLSLPVVAISSRGEKKIAKKVTGNGATEEVVVETGISDGRFVEIKSGLNEGDRVMGDFSETESGPPERRGRRIVVKG